MTENICKQDDFSVKKIKELGFDYVSKRGDVVTVRRGFFYRFGGSADKFAELVKERIPCAEIIDKGEVSLPFRGGAPVSKQSHWWVKFKKKDEL